MNLSVRAQLARDAFTLQVDHTIPLHGVTALFGRSGCGKTTLLRIIAGLERVRHATVQYGDETWQDAHMFTPLHRRQIGLVFQEHSLLPHLTVKGNMEYGYRRTPPERRRAHLHDIAELLGIAPLLEREVDQLSGGQRQRVAMGRALLSSPRLLLLDEPLAALDTHTKREIMPYLNRLAREAQVPIILVTHVPEEVERLADRVAFMRDGRIECIEDLRAALTRPNSPLFADEGPVSVLEGHVSTSLEEGLNMFHSGPVHIRLVGDAVGAAPAQRIRILARDVALAIDDPHRISVMNHLPVTIERIHPPDDSLQLVLCRLEDGQTLLSQVTSNAVHRLQLHEGQRCFALIKSAALHQAAPSH